MDNPGEVVRTVAGAEGLSPSELVAELDAGARVVAFQYVVSAVYFSYSAPKLYLVRPGESALKPGFDRTALTLLAGWWSIHGLLLTPVAVVKNCMGGTDATAWVRARCLEDMARAAQSAALAVAVLETPIDSPATRADRAMFFLSEGDAEGAWGLISEDVSRADPQLADLPRLRRLLMAFHDKQAWDSALRLGVVIARAFPAEARNGYLATVLRRVEAENGVKRGTIVPPARFWNTGPGCAVILGALLAGFVALMVWLNVWMRDHSRLHVVNGLQEELVVSIPGATPAELRLQPGQVEVLVLPEGEHRARIVRAGHESQVDVSLRVPVLARYNRHCGLRFLNPEGAAVLLQVKAAYAEPGRTPPEVEPPELHVGEPYTVFEDASQVGEPPASIPVRQGETGGTVVTHVVVLRGHPAEVADRLADALGYLELHARLAPDDADILQCYLERALAAGAFERAAKFLDEGLAGRPRRPTWCLARMRLAGPGDGVVTLTTTEAAGPDPQALALSALAAPNGEQVRRFLEQARAAAPDDPLVQLALAQVLLREGDLEGAAAAVARAPHGPERRAAQQELARRGAEPHLNLVRADLALHVRRFPFDLLAARDLLEAKAILADRTAFEQECYRLRSVWAVGEHKEQAERHIRRVRALSLGDPAELLVLDRISPEPGLRLVAQLLREDLDEAVRVAGEAGPDPDLGLEHTLLAGALAARGDARAEGAVELARGAWSALSPRGQVAATLLGERERTGDEDLLALTLSCHEVEAVRLLVAASQPAGEERRRIIGRMPAPRGPGYPAMVLRAIRERLER